MRAIHCRAFQDVAHTGDIQQAAQLAALRLDLLPAHLASKAQAVLHCALEGALVVKDLAVAEAYMAAAARAVGEGLLPGLPVVITRDGYKLTGTAARMPKVAVPAAEQLQGLATRVGVMEQGRVEQLHAVQRGLAEVQQLVGG